MAKKTSKKKIVLLTGGNPQIAKADGAEPVRAYIDAMPEWKSGVGRWIDDLVQREVPKVRRAVRWNTPFYGVEGMGWFLSYNCCTKYVKVAFHRGSEFDPVPPVASKHERVRYFHIFEDDELDGTLFASWVRQGAAIPGEDLF